MTEEATQESTPTLSAVPEEDESTSEFQGAEKSAISVTGNVESKKSLHSKTQSQKSIEHVSQSKLGKISGTSVHKSKSQTEKVSDTQLGKPSVSHSSIKKTSSKPLEPEPEPILPKVSSIISKSSEKPEKKTSKEKVAETLSLPARRKSTELPMKSSESFKLKSESMTSKARIVLGSTISIKKSEYPEEYGGEKGKGARFLNTYKLDSDRPFNPEKVQKILQEVMLEALEGPYDENLCKEKAKQASNAIRARVKELDFDRFKLVSLVTIGEKHDQDIMITCKFLWDVDRDRFAMFSHETCHVFGVAFCFGIYYE